MSKVTVTVDYVNYYATTNDVCFVLNEHIPAIVVDKETKAYVDGESDRFSMQRKPVIAQVMEINKLFKKYIHCKEEPMNQASFNNVFGDAKLVLERNVLEPGEVRGEFVAQYRMYETKFVDVQFSQDAIDGMKKKIAEGF